MKKICIGKKYARIYSQNAAKQMAYPDLTPANPSVLKKLRAAN
jgi:hypothetical protein